MPHRASCTDDKVRRAGEWRIQLRLAKVYLPRVVDSVCPYQVNPESGLVVIVYVIADQPLQMSFVQCDHVVQDLPTATPDPAFRNPVLPGRLNARPLRLQARCLEERDHLCIELRVPVEDHLPIEASLGERFSQLLQHPIGGRMAGDVAVQQFAPSLLDHEKAVQELERQRGHGKEIKGHDRLSMIGEEREPAFGWATPRRRGCRRRRYLATVRSSRPSLRSSPWIRGDPQPGFSVAIRRMRARISSLTSGRPRRRRDSQRQYRRNPVRCHPITVSGLTITRTSDHPVHKLRRVVQNRRSRPFSRGRGRLRFSTAICWRRARISSEAATRLRKKTRKAERMAGTRSSTDQPCNTVAYDCDGAILRVCRLLILQISGFLSTDTERWVRSVKRECLSRLILIGEQSLRRALADYTGHYHAERNHQGKGNVILFPKPDQPQTRVRTPVHCRERLGGLLKYYCRAA